ncbi:12652_t:CDS:2 [Dentiscutata erythropus]|uniref:12652_t:CDS:1 n=1 Tax=Dentiscutata erythropus TaxID=1348616 RepID=A0A9N9AKH8_9GLOM|nr:12652_t:CDS:2 [Dentiscutata erythropus]
MANLIDLTPDVDLKKFVEEHKNSAIVLNFWAEWANACVQMNEVFAELAKKYTTLKFIKIEAEKFSDISESFEIAAVPAFIILKNGKISDRVDGANAPELTNTVSKYAKATTGSTIKNASDLQKTNRKVDLNTYLKELTNSSPVMAFIKGTPSQPRCGFSRQIIEILNDHKVKFGSFDILSDEEVRQGLKEYSKWPTYPQLYISGELIGGLDVVKEMIENGEFQTMVSNVANSEN